MIEVDGLSFTYPGQPAPVLDNLSFGIGDGEVYGLLGPSGCGKSTTQNLLMGMLRGFTGNVELFGQPIATMGRDLYQRIGVSFELPALYLRLTALENLALFAALYNKPTRAPLEVLALVGLQDAAGQRVESFSKGMKMRLNLCRALLHDPELLFLDEPTSGQDPARARTTRELIRTLKAEGKTIFLTTHNMAEAGEICDRVGFLSGGNIPVSDTPQALQKQYGKAILDVTYLSDGAQQVVAFPLPGIGENQKFRRLLETHEIVSIHSQEASLDDIFIQVTAS